MLSTESRNALIASLTNAENTELIEQLLNEVNEIVTCLSQCGSLDEDGETTTFTANEVGTDVYKGKFEELQRKYVERFLNGGQEDKQEDEEQEEQDEIEEQEEIEIEDLFKEE